MMECTGRTPRSAGPSADEHRALSRDLQTLKSSHAVIAQDLATKIAILERDFTKQVAEAVERLEARIASASLAPSSRSPDADEKQKTLEGRVAALERNAQVVAADDAPERAQLTDVAAKLSEPGSKDASNGRTITFADAVGDPSMDQRMSTLEKSIDDMRSALAMNQLENESASAARGGTPVPKQVSSSSFMSSSMNQQIAEERVVELERVAVDVQAVISNLSRSIEALQEASSIRKAQTVETFLFPDDVPFGQADTQKSSSLGAKSSDTEAWVTLEPWRLDSGYKYELQASVWDALLFTFSGYMGCAESLICLLVWVLNLVVQTVFCMVVGWYMLDSPVDESTLISLLRFRSGIGHNVDYSDKLTRTSMVDMICGGDGKLHLSGIQMQIHQDMEEFYDGATILSILAQFAWVCTIMQELLSTWDFTSALMSIKRSDQFLVETTPASEAEEEEPEMGAARLSEISCLRLFLCLIFIVIPRLFIAGTLGVIGTRYLAVTVNMSDLLLNAMALAFIIGIDEMLCAVLLPYRTKVAISSVEALKLFPQRRLPWAGAGLRFLGIVVMIASSYFYFTEPFFGDLHQATDILCSGNTDFVVATSRATGMVHASKSFASTDDLSLAEKSVLQLAKPKIDQDTWAGATLVRLFPELDSVTKSSEPSAVLTPTAESFESLKKQPTAFDFVSSLSTLPPEKSLFIPCFDMEAGQNRPATLAQLRVIVRNESAVGCNDTDSAITSYYWPLCQIQDAIALRAICPRTCGCHLPLSGQAGAMQHPMQGCPSSCKGPRSAVIQYFKGMGQLSSRCMDTPTAALLLGLTGQWFQTWGITTFSYLRRRQNFEHGVYSSALDMFGNETVARTVARYFSTGTELFDDIADNRWQVMPGMPFRDFPDGGELLTGCRFLTAGGLKWLLGFDVCEGNEIFSLRYVCPVSCGCGSMEGCPDACFQEEPPRACQDDDNGLFPLEGVSATLSSVLGNTTITKCDEIPASMLELCGRRDSTLLREICPFTCDCHSPIGHNVGFYGSGDWGCPSSCETLRHARIKAAYEVVDGLDRTRGCVDTPSEDLLPYRHVVTARFSPDQMMNETNADIWFEPYIRGAFEHIMSDNKSLKRVVDTNVMMLVPRFLKPSQVQPLTDHILSGKIMETILSGTWELMPGMLHPLGKKGCEYLTSFIFQWMIGFDFCGGSGEETKFRTLRYLCPKSCGCGSMSGCPLQCHS